MDSTEEELEQISSWLREEGCAPNATKDAELCFMWRLLGCRLSSLTHDLDSQRSQHRAEMAEVRKSLEQIRIFTEHKDVLAQQIQDENDRLKDQLRKLISLQDSQISEVAKMLYQQGLTELIHSSPSEQVAYLLVERASLLETTEDPTAKPVQNLLRAGDSDLKAETQVSNNDAQQSFQKGAAHGHNPWRRLLGLHKATHNKNTSSSSEPKQSSSQWSSVERRCSRLERDVEEGSRRLAMAHSEIRRLTDELESAHLTQKTYEPELEAAQQAVEQLQKCEMLELRKANELNDRLDFEIRALRNRVRSLDAEKGSLQQTVVSLQEELQQLESELQGRQQQFRALQLQAEQARQLAQLQETEVIQGNRVIQGLQNELGAQTFSQRLDVSGQNETDSKHCENCQVKCTLATENKEQQTDVKEETTLTQEPPYDGATAATMLCSQDECETLKREICETLTCLDRERSKYHKMKEKLMVKLSQTQQKFDNETRQRDEKINSLERELSLCSHSLTKERELVVSVTAENEKLLSERMRLSQQLSEAELNKKDTNLTTALSKSRVDILEMENKKLHEKIIHMSNQLSVLDRTLQKLQSCHCAEATNTELKKTPLSAQNSRATTTKLPTSARERSHTQQADPPHSSTNTAMPRSSERGYLNLSSPVHCLDQSALPSALSTL